MTLVPVLLSGGSGTRLWPLSREAYPKQFLPLVGDESLLQSTWRRVAPLAGAAAVVVANENHRFMAAEQLRAVGCEPAPMLLEPVGRNTAPAIAVAAMAALERVEDAVLLVLPTDHTIGDEQAFLDAVRMAQPVAEAGRLVTFGIVPHAPETGYGYIQAEVGEGVCKVRRFVEKPDRAQAEGWLAEGGYYWNSGMFLFTAQRYLQELQRWRPEMLECCRQAFKLARRDPDFTRLDSEAFTACMADSIDYAVMEKTADAAVLPVDIGWNDVGSWAALREIQQTDTSGNVQRGDVLAMDCHNTYAWGDRRLLALIGLEDMVVVDSDDALLVAHKDRVQDVKAIVQRLREDGRSEASWHRKVYRPWGAYDCIDQAERFQVKHITVKPGAALSLQMHHHRAEHWIVVQGTARVTRGEEVFLLSENASTYIPVGTRHRLENPGKLPLELIEVQSGAYLGEDDIIRFEDVYGRKL